MEEELAQFTAIYAQIAAYLVEYSFKSSARSMPRLV